MNKEIRFPVDLVASGVFAVFALVCLVLMETQIKVGENEVVNGRNFPQLLMGLILIGSALVAGKEIKKLICKEPLVYKTINLGVELKALAMLGIMLLFYFINTITGIFVIGACVSTVLFLLLFKCKNPKYYAITLGLTVLIYIAFRFGLSVRF